MRFSMCSKFLCCSIFFAAMSGLLCAVAMAQPVKYSIEKVWHIGGDGGWDYLTMDAPAHRLYIARGVRVQVVDIQTSKLVAEIGDMQGVHGIALNSDGKTGYISDGKAGMVRVFDRASMKVTTSIATQVNPDAIVFDDATKRVFAMNGKSDSATVIDSRTNKVAGTIPLPGKPEFAEADGSGNVFVNIEDKNEVVRIDARGMKVTATWPIAPCDSPSGLALDPASHRVFSVCDNQTMIVLDARSGKVVGTSAVGNGPDTMAYDAKRHLVFSPNGQDGTLTILRQESADRYTVMQTLKTQKGARTIALDSTTGKIYLVTADFGAKPAATASNPHPRPAIVPGSFVVLVVGAE